MILRLEARRGDSTDRNLDYNSNEEVLIRRLTRHTRGRSSANLRLWAKQGFNSEGGPSAER